MIITTRPPNFDAIIRVFPQAIQKGVVFAYAPHIYSPDMPNLPQSIIDHENVHIERQAAAGVEKWWEEYLRDPQFRYEEELLAHRAEYKSLASTGESRQVCRQALIIIAKKLSASLYRYGVSEATARKDLRA